MARSSSSTGTRAPPKRHLEERSRSHRELIDQLYEQHLRKDELQVVSTQEGKKKNNCSF